MYNKLFKVFIIALPLVIAVWLTTTQLIEAYGSGPPYYGRTTNMDKWSSPIAFLIAVDVAALAISMAFFALFKCKGRSTSTPD